ncbi:MAG: DUF167 domain-containing protein [Candidatus Levyibacteriota bacterium]
MKILVNVKTGAKKAQVIILDAKHFAVHITKAPEKGKANDAVIKALSRNLKISPSRIILLRGERSKSKLFEIT